MPSPSRSLTSLLADRPAFSSINRNAAEKRGIRNSVPDSYPRSDQTAQQLHMHPIAPKADACK